MKRGGVVYIMTNIHNTTLYVGVTSDLAARIQQHQLKTDSRSFTARYNLDKLVYFEVFSRIEEAIDREKRFKKGTRKYKEKCIEKMNPEWNDLSIGVLKW